MPTKPQMKWRWRRRVKVAPGVTVNLSNSSAGVTVGGSAGRVSANTRGRVTAGQSLPGTGLYRQTTLATGNDKQRQPAPPGMAAPPAKRRGCLFYAGGGLALLIGLFGCVMLANLVGGDRSTTETPERSAGVALPTEEFTAQPTWTNTPEVATATPAPPTATAVPATATPAPAPIGSVANDIANLREGPGTDYPAIGSAAAGQVVEPVGQNSAGDWLQLASGAWIAAALVDNVPGGLPVTAAPAFLPGGNPTPAPASAPTPSWRTTVNGIEFASDCPCDQGDVLNCPDFAIPKDAQACFMRCASLVGGDVHGLDRDKDGTACEWKY
ncbi:MAG: DUF4236 domain-containing protein [Caldilineaceae bacterium]|nr:DUF4236 domain-containing protein [Caldilineaceae bacterium]